MKRHAQIVFFIGSFAFGSVAACNSSDTTKAAPVVAFVVPTLTNPFFVEMKEGAESGAKSAGVVLKFQSHPGGVEDPAGQNDLVRTLITGKPAALCLVPADSRGIVTAIEAANRAGVPILNVDNRIDAATLDSRGASVATYIGSDNTLGGRMAGEYIVKTLSGNGEVAMLEGLTGSDAARQRADGFRQAISGQSGIRLVATETASWSREQAVNKFLGILQAHPSLDALFAANDEMALGAIVALRERGTEEQRNQLIVVGFDATPDGMKAIEEHVMAATVAQDPKEMGRRCVETAAAVAAKEAVPAIIPIPVVLKSRQKTM